MLYPIVHRYSKTGKMPCKSYSLPAAACITGSRLRLVAGSVCSGCYAHEGHYHMGNVKEPRDWNLAIWNQVKGDPIQTEAWIAVHVWQIGTDRYFRWFDSGDIQGVQMLRAIVAVAERTPQTLHWLPTHEWAIVARFRQLGGIVPANLRIRISAELAGRRELVPGMLSSSVDSGYGFACQAVDGKCRECRACWNPEIENIDYHAISRLARLQAKSAAKAA